MQCCEKNEECVKWIIILQNEKNDGSEGEQKGAYMMVFDESYFSMDVSSFYLFLFYLFIYNEVFYVHFN